VLLLFDIDATLISTSRAGIHALEAAGRELFGPSFSTADVEFAGRLDPLIITDLLARHGRDATPQAHRDMRRAYGAHLAERLRTPVGCFPHLGVLDLLAALRTRDDVTLGLLTGNFAETGSIKLRACGIDPDWFPIRVWGDESPHSPPARTHLPPIGLSRYEERHRRRPPGAVIIGDTPHDVACAKAHGLRCLGVGTGQFSPDALRRAGADRAESDLSDTQSILAWLTQTP
jgi:phosphoglycolate phosphatase